tara:strand:- start:3297 stop:4040 length:744 start_codon:yes stop_codon:yes gene_type:complete
MKLQTFQLGGLVSFAQCQTIIDSVIQPSTNLPSELEFMLTIKADLKGDYKIIKRALSESKYPKCRVQEGSIVFFQKKDVKSPAFQIPDKVKIQVNTVKTTRIGFKKTYSELLQLRVDQSVGKARIESTDGNVIHDSVIGVKGDRGIYPSVSFWKILQKIQLTDEVEDKTAKFINIIYNSTDICQIIEGLRPFISSISGFIFTTSKYSVTINFTSFPINLLKVSKTKPPDSLVRCILDGIITRISESN